MQHVRQRVRKRTEQDTPSCRKPPSTWRRREADCWKASKESRREDSELRGNVKRRSSKACWSWRTRFRRWTRSSGKELRQVTQECKGTDAKGPRETDVASSDVAWMAAPGAQSSKAEVVLSDVSRVDFDCVGTLGGPKLFEQCRSPAEQEERSDTERNFWR